MVVAAVVVGSETDGSPLADAEFVPEGVEDGFWLGGGVGVGSAVSDEPRETSG